MKKTNIKQWTVLIYANGNNELEPEIWRSKLAAEKVGSSDNINVIMEIGRENPQLVKIIRPHDSMPKENESWTGVRRYYILKSKSILIKKLGNSNMADPHNLYEFIKWCIETYPAKHYMVILAGHGASYIAVMPDLSQNMPYMLGVQQMCKVINMILKDTGIKIDILVLDMCFMNSIEIMYELGSKKSNCVKNVLTYIKDGPLSGLPYDKLIYTVEQNNNISDLSNLLKNIIDNIDLNLVAIEINHAKLKKIKQDVSNVAYSYLVNKGYENKTAYQLINNLDMKDPWYNQVLQFQNSLKKIIIHYKNLSNSNCNLIYIMSKEMTMKNNDTINYMVLSYYTLCFNKNNYWFNVITTKSLEQNKILNQVNNTVQLKPIILHPSTLANLAGAMNTTLNTNDIQKIVNKLIYYKKWDVKKITSELNEQVESYINYKR